MARRMHTGSCHCGHLRLHFETAKDLADIAPRACDCDFCMRHRAAWVSDPAGTLQVIASAADDLQRHRQGSGQAGFLCCRRCGALVAVAAPMADGSLRGAANRDAFDPDTMFADAVVVSPRTLAAGAKLARWAELWTPLELLIG